MTQTLLVIITVAATLVAVFLIQLLFEARKTVQMLRKTMEEKLNPALDELNLTLKSLRNVSDNVDGITADARTLSKAVGDVGQSIASVNAMVTGFSTSTAVKVMSLRAGIMAALHYAVTHILKKGADK